MFPQHYHVLKIIKNVHNSNLLQVHEIIKSLIRREIFEGDLIKMKFNSMITDLSDSMREYYEDLLNINEEKVKNILECN